MKRIYLGNVSGAATEGLIRTLFARHGAVTSVRILRGHRTGPPRHTALVEMPNDGEANAAIEAMNGASLLGRALEVKEVKPRLVPPRDEYGAAGPASQ